jgi:hypothetical protein
MPPLLPQEWLEGIEVPQSLKDFVLRGETPAAAGKRVLAAAATSAAATPAA